MLVLIFERRVMYFSGRPPSSICEASQHSRRSWSWAEWGETVQQFNLSRAQVTQHLPVSGLADRVSTGSDLHETSDFHTLVLAREDAGEEVEVAGNELKGHQERR